MTMYTGRYFHRNIHLWQKIKSMMEIKLYSTNLKQISLLDTYVIAKQKQHFNY